MFGGGIIGAGCEKIQTSTLIDLHMDVLGTKAVVTAGAAAARLRMLSMVNFIVVVDYCQKVAASLSGRVVRDVDGENLR
jgi:hypothetical protein